MFENFDGHPTQSIREWERLADFFEDDCNSSAERMFENVSNYCEDPNEDLANLLWAVLNAKDPKVTANAIIDKMAIKYANQRA